MVDSKDADYQPSPTLLPFCHHLCPIHSSLLDTLPLPFSFPAGRSSAYLRPSCVACPSHPRSLLSPFLNLLCERGAERQVLVGGHVFLLWCWTKMLPCYLALLGGPGSGMNRHASESLVGVLVDPLALVFWSQVPWGFCSSDITAQVLIEGSLCSRWLVPVAS